ncbi:MAG TPA: PilC/PilY family type IV pilus protein, partial [Thiobacillaceae bacterium]
NFGGSRGVEIFYGANDGTFRAIKGDGGTELWSFVAPEHHGKLKRLYANTPPINYPPPSGVVGGQPKDYFFDGSSGLLQNADNSKVWIFPTMRRGGRMLYAFDITNTTPSLMWARGCPNMGNDTGCSAGYDGIGQTWSGANVAFIKGQGPVTDPTPLIIMGGGYDTCLDTDLAVTTCTNSAKGRKVYVINAETGAIVGTPFTTDAPVVADVTLIDRDFDGLVDHAYAADALGSVYRIDFTDPVTFAPIAWTMTKIAATTTGNRKFLFGPAALAVGSNVYLALGSGDRERPLITNYPYTTPIVNRFYSFIDNFSGTTLNLNGADMENFSAETDCNSVLGVGKRGWYMDLSAGTGEQTVTSAVIFGGTVFFSTNRPTPTVPGSCGTNLGEARGYAVNLLNASGVIGTGKLCGGQRSGVFTGGGIPPSPVVGVVPITQPDGTTKPTSVLIGGINLDTGSGSPIGAQEPKVPIRQLRTRLYWYPHGDR